MNISSFIFTLLLLTSPKTALATTTDIGPQATKQYIQATTTPELDSYIMSLGKCESNNNPHALNPDDLDHTPSKGRFQFKTGTFNYFSQKYHIATTSIWNGDEQEKIVRRMSQDPTVNFHRQFPDCSRRLGLPPILVE